MEYVQTVLVQIDAARIDEASRPKGLLAELDEHASYLHQLPGFQDMRVTRSINAEGNVLLVVESRWSDDTSLIEYETREPTVMSIVSKYDDLIIRDSLQVLDMEAVQTEAGRRPLDPAAEASERLALPLLLPMGILAFALLVIYGLSRVYLEIDPGVATGLAAGIAVGILVVAWFVASRPSLPAWQIASVGVIAAAVLTGGALFAVINEDEGEATEGTPVTDATPTEAVGPGPDTDAELFEVAMIATLKFDVDEITLPAETDVTISADNQDGGIPHNWAMYTDDSASELIALTKICAAACVDEVTFTTPPPGEYFFRCDVHPTQMVGTVIVQKGEIGRS